MANYTIISLLQHMSEENTQTNNILPPTEEKQHENQANQLLLEEIRNLKKVVTALAQKESIKQRQESSLDPIIKQLEQNNPESEFLQSKLRKTASKDSQVQRGQDIYKNVRSDWKVRITSKTRALSQLNKAGSQQQNLKKADESKLNLISQNQEEKSNLDQSIINKHLSFLNSRSDTDEEQPAKTQFFHPQVKANDNKSSNQFRFRKINLIPAIQSQHNRFRSYITSQRKNLVNNKPSNSRQSPSFAINNEKNSSSQPELQKKKTEKYGQTKQSKLIEELKSIQITRQSEREQLIENGKRLFKIFYDSYNEQITFNIKKYKNCIVFSLLPSVTKAIIFHYVGDIYYGNVSLDEKGRIQKNGQGIEIVKYRHFYEGYFINGKKNGRGKIQYLNGDTYDGQWNEGQIYGFGRYIQHKNDRFYEGFWKRGQYCGQKNVKQPGPFQFF